MNFYEIWEISLNIISLILRYMWKCYTMMSSATSVDKADTFDVFYTEVSSLFCKYTEILILHIIGYLMTSITWFRQA